MYLRYRFYYLLSAVILIIAMGYAVPPLFTIGRILFWLLVALVVVDMVLLWSRRGIHVFRTLSPRFSNGDDNPVSIRLESNYPFAISTEVIDEVPPVFQRRDILFKADVRKMGEATITYQLRPTERGIYSFGRVRVFASTLLGLVQRRYTCCEPQDVKVYPSYMMLRQYELLAMSNNLTEMGIKRIRRIGNNTDFEQIKDYIVGDDYRTINWRATARRHQLMVNVYQDERSQQVFSVIDKGRMMQQAFQEMEKILGIEEVRSEEGTYLFDGDKYLDMHLTDTGAWDYTLYDKGFREIDGGQLGENGNISLDDAKFQILGMHGYKDVFVMDTDKEKFEENQADISGKTYLSDNQKDYIGDVILQGFDPKEYWVNGSTIDLTGRYFSDDELSDIKYQVKVDAIPKTLYSPEQWKVIEKGISEKLDVSMYAYPSMTADQMEMTRRALIAEDKGYISREDLSVISDGSHSAEEMKQMLKEAMHTDVKVAQPVQQENGMYRYYSTQRPVAPGTFPKENGNPVDIKNYDERIDIPTEGLKAWGYVEYEKPLTEKQASDYELKPAVKVETREKSAENSSHDRRSVLADLNAKKALVSGSKIPKETRNKSKEEQL